MASPANLIDEPLTPAGRLFLQPNMDTIVHCALGLKDPIDVKSLKSAIKDSVMVRQPRFSSLMVRDHRGTEHWRRTDVEIDRHMVVIEDSVTTSETCDGDGDGVGCDDFTNLSSAAVNQYLADLSVSTPLSADKPLWEIHVLMRYRCVVLRIHHALGDGISLMSLFLASCRMKDDADADALPSVVPLPSSSKETKRKRKTKGSVWLWELVMMVWFTFVYVMEFVSRSLWVRDRDTAITGGAGVELWPRKLATARFSIQDMKLVKNALPNATINDVLFAVVTSGLSRYLAHRSPNDFSKNLRITGLAMVNLRAQPGLQDFSDMMEKNSRSRWGNQFGILLLPVYCRKACAEPWQYLKDAKAMIDRKKNSLEAYFSYKLGDLVMSFLGPKYASWLNYRIICNTTFTISNVVGPQKEITIEGNPVTYLRANTTGIPHALTMHMVSYAGRADMQILVAKDIIPDPEFLAKCFEDGLIELTKEAKSKLDQEI